jgi:hypothetical protein
MIDQILDVDPLFLPQQITDQLKAMLREAHGRSPPVTALPAAL